MQPHFSSRETVNRLRSFVVERLMKPLTIVKLEISAQARDDLWYGFVIAYVDIFVFHAAPEPFNEDVVQRTASSVHTNGDFALFENPSERIARKLRTLICIEDLRLRHLQ